jgi:Imm-5 like putative immunity protein
MSLTTTLNLLRAAHACTAHYAHLRKALGGAASYGKNTPIPLLRILDTNGLDDALWALCAVPEHEVQERNRLARIFACDCAERVLPIFERERPHDARPRAAIGVARRYAASRATNEERDAAWAAAGDAARDAAWAAAGDAARDAAWAAAGAAALAAAGDAARAAARDAAWAAAGAAARDAAWDAAWAAAGAAAWAAAGAAAGAAARAAAWAAAGAAARAAARAAAWAAARDAAGDAARAAAWAAAGDAEKQWHAARFRELLEAASPAGDEGGRAK